MDEGVGGGWLLVWVGGQMGRAVGGRVGGWSIDAWVGWTDGCVSRMEGWVDRVEALAMGGSGWKAGEWVEGNVSGWRHAWLRELWVVEDGVVFPVLKL